MTSNEDPGPTVALIFSNTQAVSTKPTPTPVSGKSWNACTHPGEEILSIFQNKSNVSQGVIDPPPVRVMMPMGILAGEPTSVSQGNPEKQPDITQLNTNFHCSENLEWEDSDHASDVSIAGLGAQEVEGKPVGTSHDGRAENTVHNHVHSHVTTETHTHTHRHLHGSGKFYNKKREPTGDCWGTSLGSNHKKPKTKPDVAKDSPPHPTVV